MGHFKYWLEQSKKEVSDWQGALESNDMLRVGTELCKEIEGLEPEAEAYIVGGAVRDLLLGEPVHDIDIATNVSMDKITDNFDIAEIGQSKDFGIVLVLYKDHQFEVAHFREEEGTTDARHPEKVTQVKSFQQDSARRDLTINSLGLRADGTIVDYQDGFEDLKNKIVRAVGEPRKRFMEDGLRILRAARFAARFGFSIDPETKEAMAELASMIYIKKPKEKGGLSAERIRDELMKSAISGPSLAAYIEHLDSAEILGRFLHEIKEMQKFEHEPETHPEGGVYDHTLAALRVSRSKDPVTNLAILFHDLGKIATRTYSDLPGREGRVRYHGHENVGVEIWKGIADRLKFSTEDTNAITYAIRHHMILHQADKLKKSTLVRIRQDPNWEILKHTARSDDASRGPTIFDEKEFARRLELIDDIYQKFGEKEEFEARMKQLINGRMIIDLAAEVGVTLPGILIGKVKEAAREWIVERDFNVTPQEVIDYVKEYLSGLE